MVLDCYAVQTRDKKRRRTKRWYGRRLPRGSFLLPGCIINPFPGCRLRADTRLTSTEPLPRGNNPKWWLAFTFPFASSYRASVTLFLFFPSTHMHHLLLRPRLPNDPSSPLTFQTETLGCAKPLCPRPTAARPVKLSDEDQTIGWVVMSFLRASQSFSFHTFVHSSSAVSLR